MEREYIYEIDKSKMEKDHKDENYWPNGTKK